MFVPLIMFLLIVITATVDRKDKENSRRDHVRSSLRVAASLIISLLSLFAFSWFMEFKDPSLNIRLSDGLAWLYFLLIFIAPVFIYLAFRKIIR
jgi:protein-S-isoprenylcysteine O-methyltransferase Ste14